MNNILNKVRLFFLLYTSIFSIVLTKILTYYFSQINNIPDFIHTIIIFMIFLNCCTVEMVHLNRYGRNTWLNITFIALQILVFILFLKINNFELKTLLSTLILLYVILSVQHITEYIITDNNNLLMKKLTEPFSYIHTGRTSSLLLGFYFIDYAYWFIFLAFAVSQLFPSFISRSIHVLDINFRELSSNIVILIIMIATNLILDNINRDQSILSIISTLVFCIVYYAYYRKIDHYRARQSANTYILGTYFFIFGMYLLNYSLSGVYNYIYILITMFCYYIGYISYRLYKKD